MASETRVRWTRPKARREAIAVPRAMPLLMRAADRIAGTGAGSTLLALACEADAEGRVRVEGREEALAHASGLGGQRRVHAFRERLKALEVAGFVGTSAGEAGAGEATLYEPHAVIAGHKGSLDEATWNAFVEVMVDQGGEATRGALAATA